MLATHTVLAHELTRWGIAKPEVERQPSHHAVVAEQSDRTYRGTCRSRSG